MKRNSLLLLAVLVTGILAFNSAKRIISLRGTSEKVAEAQEKLEKLRHENQTLKQELEYKKSSRFAEEEIRNKLGLAKEGETVVVVPKNDERLTTNDERTEDLQNWEKWRNLLFGRS